MMQDKQFLDDFHALPADKQAEVIDFIQRLKAKRDIQMVQSTDSDLQIAPGSSLTALQGLGKEVWQALDVDQYLEEERDAWA